MIKPVLELESPERVPTMEREQLERLIVTGAIRSIHAQGFRLADSAQSELHFLVRRRIAELYKKTPSITRAEIDDAIAAIARDVLDRSSLASLTSHELVIRRRWMKEVGRIFDGVWPFRRPRR